MSNFLIHGTQTLLNTQHHIFFFLEWLKLGFEMIGVLIILFGTIRALYNSAGTVFFLHRTLKQYMLFRLELGNAIIAGLEMFVAADVVSTVLKTDFHSLGIILFLVILRTALTYFLTKELSLIKKQANLRA